MRIGGRARIVIGPGPRGPNASGRARIVVRPGARGPDAGSPAVTYAGVERPCELGSVHPPAWESLAAPWRRPVVAPWRRPVVALALRLPILPRRNCSPLAVIRRRVKRLRVVVSLRIEQQVGSAARPHFDGATRNRPRRGRSIVATRLPGLVSGAALFMAGRFSLAGAPSLPVRTNPLRQRRWPRGRPHRSLSGWPYRGLRRWLRRRLRGSGGRGLGPSVTEVLNPVIVFVATETAGKIVPASIVST